MKSKVEVTLDGNRILARYPFSTSDNDKVKALGGNFLKRDECWSLPLSLSTCRGLRAAFGDRLAVRKELADWAWEQVRAAEELEDIRDGEADSPASLSVLKDRAPELWSAVSGRPYQAQGAHFALASGAALIGDQPGLGKTYMALAAAGNSDARRILITCPRSAAYSVWYLKILELLPDYIVPFIAQGSRPERQQVIRNFNRLCSRLAVQGNSANNAAALIVNTEMIRVGRIWVCLEDPCTTWNNPPGTKNGCPLDHQHKINYLPEYPELFENSWDMIIVDESHKSLASTHNRQSKYITQSRLGAVRLPFHEGTVKIAMSGTPYRSKAARAWGTLNWLRPKEFSSYWKWAAEFFEIKETRFAREVSPIPKDSEAFRDAMRPFMIARTKAEVAPELPPITYAGSAPEGNPEGATGIWLEMAPAQAKAYAEMAKLASATLKNSKRITATGVLAELTRLRQFACSYGELGENRKVLPAAPSSKIEWILGFLSEREGFDGKVIIASQFTGLLKLLKSELLKGGFPALILTGETSDKDRAIFQKRIQDPADPAWIGLINTMAGGEAITLDQADDMILMDPPWTDDVVEQVENRIHRISRIHNVTVYRLFSKGTVEEKIAGLTDQQRKDLMSLRPAGRKILASILD